MTDGNTISAAVVAYLGYGVTEYPKPDFARINLATDGKDDSIQIAVKEIIAELDNIQPDWSRYDLASASKWVSEQISQNHAELNKDALDAIAWAYSWWFR